MAAMTGVLTKVGVASSRMADSFLSASSDTKHAIRHTYEGCSNMNESSFITFFTYMLRQNVIPFWKERFVAFKMAPNIKKSSLLELQTLI